MVDDLVGLFAYDTGSTDSGIHDEVLRLKAKEWLHDQSNWRTLSAGIREMFLSEEALDLGYTIEDVHEFVQWMGDYMDFDL